MEKSEKFSMIKLLFCLEKSNWNTCVHIIRNIQFHFFITFDWEFKLSIELLLFLQTLPGYKPEIKFVKYCSC